MFLVVEALGMLAACIQPSLQSSMDPQFPALVNWLRSASSSDSGILIHPLQVGRSFRS